jgi:putative DNA primase/helicase
MRLSNLELMLEKAILAEPTKPLAKKMLFKNATPEALRDAVNNGSFSFAISSDEASNVFDSHTTRDLSFFNDGYSTTPIRVDRKSSPSFVVKKYAMTVMLMTQETVMRSFIVRKKGRARGDGFLSRFFITYPKSMRGQKFLDGSTKSTVNIEMFQDKIKVLLNLNQSGTTDEKSSNELNQKTIRLSADAANLFIEFNNRIQFQMQPGNCFYEDRDLASRTTENASRLACIFHVYENGLNGEISADTFDRAATISLWFLYQSKGILNDFSRPQDESDAQQLYDWLAGEYKNYIMTNGNIAGAYTMPVSHVYLHCRPNRLRTKSVLMSAIQGLVDRGIVQYITKPKPAYLYLKIEWFNIQNLMVANYPLVAQPPRQIF